MEHGQTSSGHISLYWTSFAVAEVYLSDVLVYPEGGCCNSLFYPELVIVKEFLVTSFVNDCLTFAILLTVGKSCPNNLFMCAAIFISASWWKPRFLILDTGYISSQPILTLMLVILFGSCLVPTSRNSVYHHSVLVGLFTFISLFQ